MKELQAALNAAAVAPPLIVDGISGPATTSAIRAFQADRGLAVDGIARSATKAALGLGARGRWAPAVARAWESFERIICAEGNNPPPGMPPLPPAAALAVLAVESNGQALGPSGRAVARFEVHLFQRAAGDVGSRFSHSDAEPWRGHEMRRRETWEAIHTGEQGREYAALAMAAAIGGEAAAHESASYGAAQILGRWYGRLGFASAVEMLVAFDDEGAQIRGLFRFLRTGNDAHANPDGDLWLAAAEGRWLDFARQYNGPGMPEWYAGHLESAALAGAPAVG